MHLRRQCSLLVIACTLGVWGYPDDVARRDGERQEDGGDPQERILDLKMNKVHPLHVSIEQNFSLLCVLLLYIYT